ncbi:MAG: hypothetical protein ACW986_13065 [Promethearchaeota archaeon]|jgi:geranylgeranyl reductase family protein
MESNTENFDVTIIGASIAGNYLCYLLSHTNLKIAVVEDHEEIGLPLQCAGIVSQKITDLIEFPPEIILNRVTRAKIVAPNGQSITLSGNENPYIIDRIALDQFFYAKVKDKKHIQYFLGERFKSFAYIMEGKQRSLLIKTSKREIKTKILVGCDGPLSVVASACKTKNKFIYATQIRILSDFKEDETALYFNPKWKESFGWIVPEGNNIYRIGLACSHNLKKNFQLFLKQLKVDFDKKISRQGGLIPYDITTKQAFNNVLLLGDSACQVKTTTGGGIIMLLTAAKYAVKCIQECFRNDDYSHNIIKKHYEKPCRSSIGRELKIHYLLRAVLERFSNEDFLQLFKIVKSSKVERLIDVYGDMDFPRTFLFKILKNPRVLPFLLKFGLKNPHLIVTVMKILVI